MASGQEEQPEPGRRPPAGQHGIIVARPFGIPVYVSPYWFIIAGVFIVIYANDLSTSLCGNTRYIVAAAFVVLLYVSVLVHELSHSVVARGFGLPVRRILLYPLGGVSEIEREAPTPGREFAVAGGGPRAVARARRARLGPVPGGALRGDRRADQAAHGGQHHRGRLQPAARPAA